MKVYIAGPWADRELVKVISQGFDDRGVEITHRWWDFEGDYSEVEKMAEYARLDLEGVRAADVLVLINTRKSEGKAVEQGLALAWGKPIIGVGEKGAESKNVFHHLPAYTWVDDPSGVWEILLEFGRAQRGALDR